MLIHLHCSRQSMLHNTPKSTGNIDHYRDIYNPLYTIGKDFIELISKVFVRAFCETEHYACIHSLWRKHVEVGYDLRIIFL